MLTGKVTVPLGDLPQDAVVSGTAYIVDKDPHTRHSRAAKTDKHEFTKQTIRSLLHEIEMIEKYRQDIVVGEIDIIAIAFPTR